MVPSVSGGVGKTSGVAPSFLLHAVQALHSPLEGEEGWGLREVHSPCLGDLRWQRGKNFTHAITISVPRKGESISLMRWDLTSDWVVPASPQCGRDYGGSRTWGRPLGAESGPQQWENGALHPTTVSTWSLREPEGSPVMAQQPGEGAATVTSIAALWDSGLRTETPAPRLLTCRPWANTWVLP